MSISDKVRKSLWAKSGNRCSICKTELFDYDPEKRELNVGEECHIISGKKNGPRHIEMNDYDTIDNLILLCRNHHKEVDTLTDTYTEELLRFMKQSHENWVNQTLKSSIDKNPKPKFLFRITSGKELLEILSATGCRTDYDEISTEEEAELIGGLSQDFLDYLDIISMSEPYEKVKITLSLKKIIDDMEGQGYYLFGEKKLENWEFNGEKSKLEIATLVVKKIESDDIIKVNLDGSAGI